MGNSKIESRAMEQEQEQGERGKGEEGEKRSKERPHCQHSLFRSHTLVNKSRTHGAETDGGDL